MYGFNNNFNPYNANSNNLSNLSELEQQIIDKLYPDPNKLTYEEMLKLEEEIGKVSKGFTHIDLTVNILK